MKRGGQGREDWMGDEGEAVYGGLRIIFGAELANSLNEQGQGRRIMF